MSRTALAKVVPLRPRSPRATHCLDCDPKGAAPFRVPYRADSRTGDIVTPCPACGRYALVELVRSVESRELRA
jgi:hypothetical protein